ncbi:MAG: hypothetical protein U9N52_13160 [Campylobacterota bacterium]|nr:hypothetical protein [Campylobacterota bacterium]
MTYIITALHAEARPFLDRYKLKRIETLPFALYENEEILLAVTQSGYENAMIATAALLAYRKANAHDLLINIGICGAPTRYKIGSMLIIHKIMHQTHSYYPDILLSHPFEESDLITVNEAQSTSIEQPVDMEAYPIFKVASRFMQLHQLLFIKIVSDHFEPKRVNKEDAIALIAAKIPQIETLIHASHHLFNENPLYTQEEQSLIKAFKSQLTKSQQSQLDDALHYFRLKKRCPLEHKLFETADLHHKKKRGEAFEELISTLYL